jgi:hypothetical protein
MNVGFFVPVVVAAALASSCDDEGGLFDSLRSESSVYYYNQITSQDAADQSNLTVDFTVEGDETDSVNDVGYSREDEAPELNVRIDDSENNEENAVQLRGASQSGAALFSQQARLNNDTSYTAVSYGDTTVGSVNVGLFQQDQSDVESGTRFRVINTVNTNIITDAFSLDLRYSNSDDGDYFATGLGLGDATDYQTTDRSTLNLVVVRNNSDPEEEIDRVECSINGGRAYDVILAVNDPLNVPQNIDDADGELVIYCHPHERI